MAAPDPTNSHGFLMVAGATVLAVLVVQPIVNYAFQRVFGTTPAQVLQFRRAS